MKRNKHNMTNTNLYFVWKNIKQRCFNKKNIRYKDYGGRGISMCCEWENEFLSFYDWATTNGYKEHLTIDRINNDGNYEPSNCRWTDEKTQSRNRRIHKSNTSGYRGVSFDKIKKCWVIQISTDFGRFRKCGYRTAEEAGSAYDKYVIENNLQYTTNKLYKNKEQ